MWNTDQLGRAVWQRDDCSWCLDARGGRTGISLCVGDAAGEDGKSERIVAMQPVDQPALPTVAEQFVRGDELHLTYPQGDGLYELRLVIRPMESTAARLVLETIVAIQTDRLDTHPKIDLVAVCDRLMRPDALPAQSFEPAKADQPRASHRSAAPISVGFSGNRVVGVLLGPHDCPFTTDLTSEHELRLRLFGDFLEKGVIRKARPWWVISRDGPPPSESELAGWWKQLRDRPLPLTA